MTHAAKNAPKDIKPISLKDGLGGIGCWRAFKLSKIRHSPTNEKNKLNYILITNFNKNQIVLIMLKVI